MILAIATVIYALITIVSARVIAGHLAYNMMQKHNRDLYNRNHQINTPNGDMWFGAGILGAIMGILWPITLVVVITPFKAGAESRHEARLREQYVKELEERLEIH